MSSRVTVNGKSYHRDQGAAIRPIHRPHMTVPASERFAQDRVRCLDCTAWCYVVRGPNGWYWRHEPDTFWTSR